MGIDSTKNVKSKTVFCYNTHNAKIAMFFEDWRGLIITKKNKDKLFSNKKSKNIKQIEK